MDTLSYKTISATAESAQKEWVVIDATDQVLGRLCAKVAKIVRGKYKPCYTPHVDCGDNVIIINADKVVLTGNKWDDRKYLSYTGYPGGQRVATPRILQLKSEKAGIKAGKHPLVIKVMKGMLPKNTLGRAALTRCKIYKGAEHKNAAQKPEAWTLD